MTLRYDNIDWIMVVIALIATILIIHFEFNDYLNMVPLLIFWIVKGFRDKYKKKNAAN